MDTPSPDPELKFGPSVSDLIEAEDIWSIHNAQVGDVLILTKPLGTGIVNHALRKGKIDDGSAVYRASVESMVTLTPTGARGARTGGAMR